MITTLILILFTNYVFWFMFWVLIAREDMNIFSFLILSTMWIIILIFKPDWWFAPYHNKFDNNYFVKLIRK